MSTQVRTVNVPTVNITVESIEPKIILESAQELITQQINSKLYKEYIELENKSSVISLFFDKVKSWFNILDKKYN